MVDVERLEALGRMIMAASVEAEYLNQRRVVDNLDAAFAGVVGVLVDLRVRGSRVGRVEELESVGEDERGG